MPEDDALARLKTLPGVGPFFARGILFRGAGTVDSLVADEVMTHAVAAAYRLPSAPELTQLTRMAETWRPYRMWTVVLLNVWARTELGLPKRRPTRGAQR